MEESCSGSLADHGVDDDFIRSLASKLKPDSFALFLPVRKVQPEKVFADLTQFKGEVIRTSLSPDQENVFRRLSDIRQCKRGIAGHARKQR